MKYASEILSNLSSVFAFLVSTIALWNMTRGVLGLLATIQRKLTVLKALFIGLRAEVRDVQKFLNLEHGYHLRGTINEIEEDLLKEYDNEKTGF